MNTSLLCLPHGAATLSSSMEDTRVITVTVSIDKTSGCCSVGPRMLPSGRPIWYHRSWAPSSDYVRSWEQYAMHAELEDDIECEGRCATTDYLVSHLSRFRDTQHGRMHQRHLGWDETILTHGVWRMAHSWAVDNEKRRERIRPYDMGLCQRSMYVGCDLTKDR